MSEPMSYALSVAIPAPNLRDWLSAPCPGPERWDDWHNLQISLDSALFELAERQRGRQIGAILAELARSDIRGWHFSWIDGWLELVALEGSDNWSVHMLYLSAFRALGDHGAGPGEAVAHGYVWREGLSDWGLEIGHFGKTRLSAGLEPGARTRLDALVLPIVVAARAGETGIARNDLDFWQRR